MASRFIWFLGSLLALLFCLIAETETANDIGKMHADTLEKMQIAGRKMLSKQFAVLHLPGKNIGGCRKIKFNNPEGVDAHCNFAPVFEERNEAKGINETRRHSEWQLIHTALKPMLEKWKKEHEKKCPEELYLYTFNAPDYINARRRAKLTCTQAIVYKIPEILKEDSCGRTTIVVGFSQVGNDFKNSTLKSCELMKKNNIIVHNLKNGRSNKEKEDCRLVAEIGVQNTG